ncbi:MAG: 3-isopropylmalate dehydratase [Alphaproteobacteria bacterium]|nr:3-isopropylmalate dehydratase [Alphaproteobacteria bacterium]
MDAVGIDCVFDTDRVYFVTDHDVVYTSPRAVERGTQIRRIVKEWGIKNFFDVGQGGHGHIFPIQAGMVTPGTFYFDNDRHCTNAGGIGAVGFRVGTEIATVLATGTVWTKVPPTIRLTLKGKAKPGVFGRDIGFRIVQDLAKRGVDLDYRVLELAGDLDQFSLDERVALCSSPTEQRAIGVFIPPSAKIVAEARARSKRPFEPVYSDPDAEYELDLTLDLAEIEPQVVLTGGVDRGVDIAKMSGKAINHAFIGSCGSGMYEDLVAAAKLLKGRRVAPGVRLFVVPGSELNTKRMQTDGLMQVFVEAGAMVMPAGCGICSSGKMGPVHSGEVSISTAADNVAGRFGAKDAELLLASPATVAASAVAGVITDPRDFQAFPPKGEAA